MLKCCGRPIRPKRFVYKDDDGLKVLKIGKCNNLGCGITVIETEGISLFGRLKKECLRGKKADRFLEKNKDKFVEQKLYREYKPNRAKGFYYCNTFWDLKKNKIKIERRELSTNRLISWEYLDLIAS